MDLSHKHRLLGDIGATNVRFALLSNGVLGPIKWFTVADFPRFTGAVATFLDRHCRQVSVCEALLAVAGPVENNRCVLTNSEWTIDAPELCAAFSFARVHILNDFEATALSLPLLTAADLYPVGGGEAALGAPMAVLGPGTGLGVACFVPGSHIVSGLENLYRAVIAIDGIEAPKRNAAEITNAALDGTCPAARATLDLFCAMLGTFAGNVALMFGARGGVFIAGGIAPRLTEYIAHSEFRPRFEHKGRFREYLVSIPTSIIVHPAATFMGLRAIAEREDTTNSLDRTRAERH
jgi:glucokinase